jgi:hypothetical protein
MISSRGNYVFTASDTTRISNFGLVGGKVFGNSGHSYAIQPYGFEFEYRYEPVVGMPIYFQAATRAVPTSLRLRPGVEEQDAWDAFATGSLVYESTISHDISAGFELGLRLRRWLLESGPIPDAGHLGVVGAVLVNVRPVDLLFEAGLMAIPSSVSPSLGVQRDASTLRVRADYHWKTDGPGFTPWVEFFHTHRNFYASSLIAGEPALFFDEAMLSLGVSYEF